MHENKYGNARIAVDPVIFTIKNGDLFVYLNKREKSPFKNKLELPGGLLQENETAEETLRRKLKDFFGKKIYFQQFYTFSKPDRDPRIRTISIGFVALISPDKVINSENFHLTNDIKELAFDHKEIINKAHEYLRENLNHKIASQFLPENFALNDLQNVYEIINEKKYDNRNFRRKMISSGVVIKAGKTQENVNHRPSILYKFI